MKCYNIDFYCLNEKGREVSQDEEDIDGGQHQHEHLGNIEVRSTLCRREVSIYLLHLPLALRGHTHPGVVLVEILQL